MWEMTKVAVYASLAKQWVMSRLGERTTYDGVVIVALCGSYILFESILTLGAYVGVLYGLWTMYKEQN